MSTEAKVGAFVIAAVVVLVIALYMVHSTHTVRGQVAFKTYFQDAGGLEADASVLFGGSKVGRITAVHPWADDPTRIEVTFEVTATTPMNQQSIAQIGTVSLMGSPVLMITTGTNDSPRLREGAVVESREPTSVSEITRRVATAAESANALLLELQDELPAVTSQTQSVLTNLQVITGPRNQEQVRRVLDDMSTLLKNADSVVASMEPVVSNVNQTAAAVDQTVNAIRGPLLDDVTGLGRAIDEARALVIDLRTTAQSNNEDVGDLVRALGATAQNLRAFSDVLKERPWSLIRTTQPADRKVPQ